MGVNNYDLKTAHKLVGSAGTVSLGMGAVPAGMKRWITFLDVQNVHSGRQRVYLCSTPADLYATTLTRASGSAFYRCDLFPDRHQTLPKGTRDPDAPIFAIAASNYVTAVTDRGPALLTLQYYDR